MSLIAHCSSLGRGGAVDGYMLLATSTAVPINETLFKTPGYRSADFAPVAFVASTPEIWPTTQGTGDAG